MTKGSPKDQNYVVGHCIECGKHKPLNSAKVCEDCFEDSEYAQAGGEWDEDGVDDFDFISGDKVQLVNDTPYCYMDIIFRRTDSITAGAMYKGRFLEEMNQKELDEAWLYAQSLGCFEKDGMFVIPAGVTLNLENVDVERQTGTVVLGDFEFEWMLDQMVFHEDDVVSEENVLVKIV